ncbi:MAG TPA: PKD domain-containing protein [Thermoplasmata archaeon]|nr:PKD domain-containing protein [Thermoplasmata archaeon]
MAGGPLTRTHSRQRTPGTGRIPILLAGSDARALLAIVVVVLVSVDLPAPADSALPASAPVAVALAAEHANDVRVSNLAAAGAGPVATLPAGHNLSVFTANLSIGLGAADLFEAFYPDGSAAVRYTWTFGDSNQTTNTTPIVVHRYAVAGLYAVYVSAQDAVGATDDNQGHLLTVLVRDDDFGDVNLNRPLIEGGSLVSGQPVLDRATPILSGGSVTLWARLVAVPQDARYALGAPSFGPTAGSSAWASLGSLSPGASNWTATVTFSTSTPAGIYDVDFRLPSAPVAGASGPTVVDVFRFSIPVGGSYAVAGGWMPSSPRTGLINAVETGPGGFSSLDPAIDYDTFGADPISNIYETLIVPNGTRSGSNASDYLPELATCVAGTPLCQKLYSSSLVSGDNFTFVIDPKARFYDPSAKNSWPVFPTDVVFSVARTLAFADLPCFGCNNGWILAQALLPQGNANWDGGMHAPSNNTPNRILASMTINGSQCPKVGSVPAGNGCVTFFARGGGHAWPFFLDLVAQAWGGSVVPAGWASANPQTAGIPYWTAGNVSGTGDRPVVGMTSAQISAAGATGWDNYERAGANPPFAGNLQFSAAGSGPYYLYYVMPGQSTDLRASPSYAANANCKISGCPAARGFYAQEVNVTWSTSDATTLLDWQSGLADVAVPGNLSGAAEGLESGLGWASSARTNSIAFDAFNLAFNVTNARNLAASSSAVNVPSTWFSHVGMRRLFAASFPYAGALQNVSVAGILPGGLYGGVIPPAMAGYPSNVSWPTGDPTNQSAVVGSAGWWWTAVRNSSGPFYDPDVASCSATSPCVLPLFTDPSHALEMRLWAAAINRTTGGAIQPFANVTSFFNIVIGALFTSPYGSPLPVFPLGWAPDFGDPRDYVSPMLLPDSTYTSSDTVAEQLALSTFNATTCHAWSDYPGWAASSASFGVSDGCQGAAWAALQRALAAAAFAPIGTGRDLTYAESEQITNALGLYVYTHTARTISLLAPWVDPNSTDTAPMLGGAGVPIWSDLNLRTSSTSPLAEFGPVIVPSPVNVTAGTPLRFATSAGGGSGGYTYAWTNLPPDCAPPSVRGSFVCASTATGTYLVTVTATDVSGSRVTSEPVLLRIYTPPQPLTVAARATTPRSGLAPLTVSFASTVVGGDPPYSYNWSFGDGMFGAGAATSHTFTAVGNYSVNLTITDQAGRVRSLSAPIRVAVVPPLGVPTLRLDRPAIDLGESVHLNATAGGGVPPYSFLFAGLPPGCVSPGGSDWLCTPSATGSYSIDVIVNDSTGASHTSPGQRFLVLPAPATSLPLGPKSIDVGQRADFTTTATAGSGSYSAYAWRGLGSASCTGLTGPAPSCVFGIPGSYTVAAAVTDSFGFSGPWGPGLSVAVAPAIVPGAIQVLGGTSTPSGYALTAGTNATFFLQPIGGLQPFTIRWSGLPAECGVPSGSSFACSVRAEGTYTVAVSVTDANGGSATSVLALVVQSAAASGCSPCAPSLLGGSATSSIVLGVVAAAVIAVGVAVTLRRRGRSRLTSEPTVPDPQTGIDLSSDGGGPENPGEPAAGPPDSGR